MLKPRQFVSIVLLPSPNGVSTNQPARIFTPATWHCYYHPRTWLVRHFSRQLSPEARDWSNTDKNQNLQRNMDVIFFHSSPAPEMDLCPLLPRSQSRQGPSLRLSWPTAGDRRRAVVGKSPLPNAASRNPHAHAGDTHIVQVSPEDMEMHYYLSHPAPNGNTSQDNTEFGPVLTRSRAHPASLGHPRGVESDRHTGR